MFKWYKDKRKQKFEEQIRENIKFNEYRINQYKNYPNKVKSFNSKFDEETCICSCLCRDDWDYISKFDVDKELWDKQVMTYKIAIEEFNRCEQRIKEEQLAKEEREKINLYKKAILELKQEGKI